MAVGRGVGWMIDLSWIDGDQLAREKIDLKPRGRGMLE